MYSHGQTDLTTDDLSKGKWAGKLKDHERNPFLLDLTKLVKSSPKIGTLKMIIELATRRKDWASRPGAGIISCDSPFAALIIYLWVKHIYNKEHEDSKVESYLITAETERQERTTICQSFNDSRKGTVLIGVARVIGTGLTLTRATYCVMFEQLTSMNLHLQCQARGCRKTNYNWDGFFVFELFDEKYNPERHAQALRMKKKDIVNSTAQAMVEEISGQALVDDQDPAIEDSNAEEEWI
jgi:hypothetical protein